MSLNLKNERVLEKIRRLAEARNTIQTAIIEHGVDLLAARQSAEDSQSQIEAIFAQSQIEAILAQLQQAAKETDLSTDFPYDEYGVPR